MRSKVTDPDSLLDMQREQGLSVYPFSSPLIIKSGFLWCIHGLEKYSLTTTKKWKTATLQQMLAYGCQLTYFLARFTTPDRLVSRTDHSGSGDPCQGTFVIPFLLHRAEQWVDSYSALDDAIYAPKSRLGFPSF